MSGVGQVLKMGAKGVDALVDALRTFKKAPQEDALMLAQQRAALPIEKGGLGLSPTNTAAERAAAMKFDIPTYHGTDANIVALDPKRTKNLEGVFSTTYPKQAEMYAKEAAEKMLSGPDGGANILPMLLNSDAHKVVPKWDMETINRFKKYGSGGVYRPESQVAVTFNPDDARSVFAAFDPWRKTAATAATMGVAAPDLLAQELRKK
jgi:hypothetical protein